MGNKLVAGATITRLEEEGLGTVLTTKAQGTAKGIPNVKFFHSNLVYPTWITCVELFVKEFCSALRFSEKEVGKRHTPVH